MVTEEVCTAICTLPLTDGLATEVAVIVAEVALGTLAGAVYVTELVVWALNVPMLESDQLTPLPLESFATVAVMLEVPLGATEVGLADTETVIEMPAGVPPPPHADKKANPATKITAENLRTIPPLAYVIDSYSLRQFFRIKCPTRIRAHPAGGLDY